MCTNVTYMLLFLFNQCLLKKIASVLPILLIEFRQKNLHFRNLIKRIESDNQVSSKLLFACTNILTNFRLQIYLLLLKDVSDCKFSSTCTYHKAWSNIKKDLRYLNTCIYSHSQTLQVLICLNSTQMLALLA